MKRALGKGLQTVLKYVGIFAYRMGLADWVIQRSPMRCRALLYHAVTENPCSFVEGLNVTVSPETFATHMRYAKAHYDVVAVDQLSAPASNRPRLVITFDDGYYSVKEHALPVLTALELPSTVYLIGSAMDNGTVWINQLQYAINENSAATHTILQRFGNFQITKPESWIRQAQRTLTISQVKQLIVHLTQAIPESTHSHGLFCQRDDVEIMRKGGVDFGFHTRSHVNLCLCTARELADEIEATPWQDWISSQTLAYPFGYYLTHTAAEAKTFGYRYAMAVGEILSSNPFHIGRSEPFVTTEAELFAQIEVIEPVLSIVKDKINHINWVLHQPLSELFNHKRSPT